jgi:DNA-directed RNA polymerase alpha subunit
MATTEEARGRELWALELRRKGLTLKRIGEAFGGLTRERARQLVLNAEREQKRLKALMTADENDIARLDLRKARSRNCLTRTLGCETIDDVCGFTARELLECDNFGEGSLADIEQALAKVGRSLAG